MQLSSKEVANYIALVQKSEGSRALYSKFIWSRYIPMHYIGSQFEVVTTSTLCLFLGRRLWSNQFILKDKEHVTLQIIWIRQISLNLNCHPLQQRQYIYSQPRPRFALILHFHIRQKGKITNASRDSLISILSRRSEKRQQHCQRNNQPKSNVAWTALFMKLTKE